MRQNVGVIPRCLQYVLEIAAKVVLDFLTHQVGVSRLGGTFTIVNIVLPNLRNAALVLMVLVVS
jgi:hypothetical protein